MSTKKASKLRIIILITSIVVVLAIISVAILFFNQQDSLSNYNIVQMSFSSPNNSQLANVNVYLALSSAQQQNGLMHQNTMGSCNYHYNCYGMLFVFNTTGEQCFWMKNTIMPLKQFWITNNTITSMLNATPYSTAANCHQADEVLEAANNSTLAIGDKVYLKTT